MSSRLHRIEALHDVTLLASLLAVAPGMTTLIGWAFNFAGLKSITQALATINANASPRQKATQFIFCEGPPSERKIENCPKVVLLDVKLPKVDGLEVLPRLKSDPRTQMIPVVESHHPDVTSYIIKPVNFEQFSEAVQKFGDVLASAQPPAPTGGINAKANSDIDRRG